MYKMIKQNMSLNFFLPKIMISAAGLIIVGKIIKSIINFPLSFSNFISLSPENLYGFESAILAFFIPIGLFLFDSRSNDSATSVNWDNTVIIEKVIKARVIFPVIILISLVPIFKILPNTIVVIVLLVLYAYIFDSIQSSYYWITDGNNPKSTYRTDKRIEYLLNLKDNERTYEVLQYIILSNDWNWISENKLIEIILKKTKLFLDASVESWDDYDKLMHIWINLFYQENNFRFKKIASIETTLRWLEDEYTNSNKKNNENFKAIIVGMYEDVYEYATTDKRNNFNLFIRSYFVAFIEMHKGNTELVESYISQLFELIMVGLYTSIPNEKYDLFALDKRAVDWLINSENIKNNYYITKAVAKILSEHINKSTYHILIVADIDQEEKYNEVVQLISDLMPNVDPKLYMKLIFLDSLLSVMDEQNIEEPLAKILQDKYFRIPAFEPKHRSSDRYSNKRINIDEETIDAFKFVTGISNDIYFNKGELSKKLDKLKSLLREMSSNSDYLGAPDEIQKFKYNIKFVNELINKLS